MENLSIRRILIIFIALTLVPQVVAGITHTPVGGADGAGNDISANSLNGSTIVATQGRKTAQNGKLLIYDQDGRVIWSHDTYWRYYDVDPLQNNQVLVAVNPGPERQMSAVIIDLQTKETVQSFRIPPDTHDVDYLGDGEYAVADIRNDIAYVHNINTNSTIWEWQFFPDRYTKGKDGEKKGGWTHLNDIDPVQNGSKLLLSPRNFDRVLLINRSSKEVIWTLGEENNYDILHEQHNPDLLSRSPPVVLVADSENDRVVEYRREGQSWNATWGYDVNLNWPRDADRLPNGNTLIVNTRAEQVLEVTSEGNVVWQVATPQHPYDAERLPLSDGSVSRPISGNGITKSAVNTGIAQHLFTSYKQYYDLSQFVFPIWIGEFEFLILHLSVISVLSLIGLETSRQLREWDIPRTSAIYSLILTLTCLCAAYATLAISVGTGIFAGMAVLTALRMEDFVRPFLSRLISDSTGFRQDQVTRISILSRTALGVSFILVVLAYIFITFSIELLIVGDSANQRMSLFLHIAVIGLVGGETLYSNNK